ncbi:hypothetical protein WMY93_011019 [Mugilogobius chulae]|uniref:Uncharacterized protein n=1 Tax=Mugilogobius chulae TaxID=88201 RepID=A0AAW0PA99_9GOBI
MSQLNQELCTLGDYYCCAELNGELGEKSASPGWHHPLSHSDRPQSRGERKCCFVNEGSGGENNFHLTNELNMMEVTLAFVACLCFVMAVASDPCLIISEINADNPDWTLLSLWNCITQVDNEHL